MKFCPSCFMRADGQTDMAKLIVAYGNLANASGNAVQCVVSLHVYRNVTSALGENLLYTSYGSTVGYAVSFRPSTVPTHVLPQANPYGIFRGRNVPRTVSPSNSPVFFQSLSFQQLSILILIRMPLTLYNFSNLQL